LEGCLGYGSVDLYVHARQIDIPSILFRRRAIYKRNLQLRNEMKYSLEPEVGPVLI